jgi:hypothetical protein
MSTCAASGTVGNRSFRDGIHAACAGSICRHSIQTDLAVVPLIRRITVIAAGSARSSWPLFMPNDMPIFLQGRGASEIRL